MFLNQYGHHFEKAGIYENRPAADISHVCEDVGKGSVARSVGQVIKHRLTDKYFSHPICQNGRASCRERVQISVVAVSSKKK